MRIFSIVQKVAYDYSTKSYYRLEGCFLHGHDCSVQLTNRNVRNFSTFSKIENECFNWECESDIRDNILVEKRFFPCHGSIVFASLTFI